MQAGLMTLLAMIPSSCIKDEPKNDECDIESAWIDDNSYASLFYDANQMRKDPISSAENEIVFLVRSVAQLPKELPISFKITEGATIEPASGSKQDFTAGPVTYTVTSEDGSYKRQYKVSFREPVLPSSHYSFEYVENSPLTATKSYYHIFYEINATGEREHVWETGNSGASITTMASPPEKFPTYSIDNGYQGKGVCLTTTSMGEFGRVLKKPIAPGSLFIGKFIIENLITNTTKTTQFGIPVNQAPLRVAGYYKYTPGEEFIGPDMKPIPGRTDEADIYGIFYRNKDANGNDVFLYADDVLTSPYLVKIARVQSYPPTDEWTRFELFFEGDEIDPTILADHGYNLSVVFSSSKAGARFEGAVGSKLCIDEIEITYAE